MNTASNSQNSLSRITANVADYYSAKVSEYGNTPQEVDWNSQESHYKLKCKLIKEE